MQIRLIINDKEVIDQTMVASDSFAIDLYQRNVKQSLAFCDNILQARQDQIQRNEQSNQNAEQLNQNAAQLKLDNNSTK